MKWFGPVPWSRLTERVDTPVGKPCLHCDAPISGGERGVVMPFQKAFPEIGDPVMFVANDGVIIKGKVIEITVSAEGPRYEVRPDECNERWNHWSVPHVRLIVVATDCAMHRVCLLAALGLVP